MATAVILLAPVTGLLSEPRLPSRSWMLLAGLIALIVGALMSMPLTTIETRMTNVASARRVVHAVATAAVGLLVAALTGVHQQHWLVATISLTVLWLVLSISVVDRPLAAAATPPDVRAPLWLPTRPAKPFDHFGKRSFDVISAALALVVLAPVMLIVAVAIKAHDGGPVFFRQLRVGRNGVAFEMIKFRSMVLDAEERKAELRAQSDRSGPLFKMTDDPRITPVGRYIRELSIDELPQLFNILRGEMSVVGPRPALFDEAQHFDAALLRRTNVTPGLTGLWQAEARNDADFARFRELDLRYVATASPSLDFWIIAATATEVLVATALLPLNAVGLAENRNDGIRPTDTDPPTGPSQRRVAA